VLNVLDIPVMIMLMATATRLVIIKVTATGWERRVL